MGTVELSAWPEVDLAAASALELLAAVEAVDVRSASENGCLGAVVAGERIVRYVNALQARCPERAAAQAALAQQVPASQSCGAIDGVASVGAEVGLALGLSRKMSTDRVGDSVLLTQELPAILQLVQDSLLDWRAAVSVYTQMRQCLEPGTAEWEAVQAALAKLLPGKSLHQIRYATQRAVQAIDPSAAAKRHREAKQERYARAFPLPDGMGGLDIRLRADAVTMVDAVLDALADGCRDASNREGAPDPRNHQQRRADALEAVFRAIQEGAGLPVVEFPPGATNPAGHVAADVAGEEPSADSGCTGGKADAGHGGSKGNGAFSGCTCSDGTGSDGTGGDGTGSDGSGRCGGRCRAGNAGGLPRVLGWWLPPSLPREQGRRPRLVVTVSADTLRGADDLPGELQGFGAIPAELAREIARQAAQVTVVRVGRPQPHGPGDQQNCPEASRRYKPRQSVIDKVTGRFQTCAHPGCTRKAFQCDLDHVVPYAKGGRSCPCNLVPRCRFHHRLKTFGGWFMRFSRPAEPYPEGTTIWRSRLGQRHIEPPPALPGMPGWKVGAVAAKAGETRPKASATRASKPATVPTPRPSTRREDDADPESRARARREAWERELARVDPNARASAIVVPDYGEPSF